MRKYKGVKKIEELLNDCNKNGWSVDKEGYDNGGDWILIKDVENRMVQVQFNTVNGNFFVYKPCDSKPVATHLSEELDNDELYSEILELVYQSA